MQSKLQKAKEQLQRNMALFSCPLCREAMALDENTIQCKNKHSFDIARKGYVHFAPDVKTDFYQKALFENRRKVYGYGLYDPLAAMLQEAARAAVEDKCFLLDAGCGEGFFIQALADLLPPEYTFFGVDLSKESIQLATHWDKNAVFLVGDIARLPFQDNSINVLFNILSPAHYSEFRRILKPGGLLIKVVPGREYLKEIRIAAGMREGKGPEQVIEHMKAQGLHMTKKTLHYQKEAPEYLQESIIKMSPVSNHLKPAEIEKIRLEKITVHLEVLTGWNNK